MIDRLLAIISLALVTAFCTLVIYYIARLDLAIVVAICLLMAAFDMLIYSFGGKREDGSKGPPR